MNLNSNQDKLNYIIDILNDKVENVSKFNVGKYLKNNDNLFLHIIKKTEFLNNSTTYTPLFTQRLWHIKHNTQVIPRCQECNGEVMFKNITYGYKKCCSKKCALGETYKTNFKNSIFVKYGVENVSQIEEVKKQKKETSVMHFGEDNYNNRIKAQQTIFNKYGVENIAQNQEIKEKTKATNNEKYGYDSTLSVPEFITKNKEIVFLKYGVDNVSKLSEVKKKKEETTFKNFGVTNSFHSETIKEKSRQTCLKKYGVEYPAQNSIIQELIHKNSFLKKNYVMPSGKIVTIQGYENYTLDLLLQTHDEDDLIVLDKEIENIVGKIWYTGEDNKQHRYYPDLYCISENKIYETKSEYTFICEFKDNQLKMESCKKAGLNFTFNVFNKKHKLLTEQEIEQLKKPEF